MNILNNITNYLSNALYILPIALISLTFHECAHGFLAYKLGDPTAKIEGRLTLNPLKHIDPLGLIMMFLVHFGWAKPVPVNPIYFKNPKRGMMLTALAGPLSNLILAFFSSFFSVFFAFIVYRGQGGGISTNVFTFFYLMTVCNLSLAVFNLIPVYPMDGSRILAYFLPQSYTDFMYRYGNYIYIAFIALVVLTDYVGMAIATVQSFLFGLLNRFWIIIIGLIA